MGQYIAVWLLQQECLVMLLQIAIAGQPVFVSPGCMRKRALYRHALVQPVTLVCMSRHITACRWIGGWVGPYAELVVWMVECNASRCLSLWPNTQTQGDHLQFGLKRCTPWVAVPVFTTLCFCQPFWLSVSFGSQLVGFVVLIVVVLPV